MIVTLCIECSGIHRGFGVHISKIRSLTLDRMEISTLRMLQRLGNDLINGLYLQNISSEDLLKKSNSTSDRNTCEIWANLKYLKLQFISFTQLNQSEIEIRFLEAASNGDISEIVWCKIHGVNINCKDSMNNDTALHKSVRNAFIECCEYLIQNGADAYILNDDKNSPLAIAEELELLNIVEMLNGKNN